MDVCNKVDHTIYVNVLFFIHVFIRSYYYLVNQFLEIIKY